MNINRRRRLENRVPVGAFAPYLLAAILVVALGLTWIYYKNQLFHQGESIRSMEAELAGVGRKNEAARLRIQALSTYAALQKCRTDGTIRMVEIPSAAIVKVGLPQRGELASSARAAAASDKGGVAR